jgi:hypothetical protein
VLTDVPTLVPPKVTIASLEPLGKTSDKGGSGAPAKVVLGLSEGASDADKVAFLLHTVQAECDQFATECQQVAEKHEAEIRNLKARVESSSGTNLCPSASLSVPLPGSVASSSLSPLSSLPLPPHGAGLSVQAVGSVVTSQGGPPADELTVPVDHDWTLEKVVMAVVAASLFQATPSEPKSEKLFTFDPSSFVDPVKLQHHDVLPSIVIQTIDRGFFVPLSAMTADVCAKYEQDSSIIPSIRKLISHKDASKEAEFVDVDKIAANDLTMDKSHWLQGYERLLCAMKTNYHPGVIASVSHLSEYFMAHCFFDLQFPVIAWCDLWLCKKFFNTMVDLGFTTSRRLWHRPRRRRWMPTIQNSLKIACVVFGPSANLHTLATDLIPFVLTLTGMFLVTEHPLCHPTAASQLQSQCHLLSGGVMVGPFRGTVLGAPSPGIVLSVEGKNIMLPIALLPVGKGGIPSMRAGLAIGLSGSVMGKPSAYLSPGAKHVVRVVPPSMSARSVVPLAMETSLSPVDELYKVLSPFNPDAFEHILHKYNLLNQFLGLISQLCNGFSVFHTTPSLSSTFTPSNWSSAFEHSEFIDNYFAGETCLGRISGPSSREQVQEIFAPLSGHF